MAPFMR